MTRPHLSSLAAGAVIAFSPLAVAGVAGAAAAATGAAHRSASHVTIVDCLGHKVATPRTYVLACGDGNTALVRLHWSDWGRRTANASGTEELNLCVPDCVKGRIARFPVRVTADHLRGGRYRQIVVRAGDDRPKGVPRTERWYPIKPAQ